MDKRLALELTCYKTGDTHEKDTDILYGNL